ncbi:lysylphosphatidylglycerol synthase transmembrane domain-containing protein [Yoonia sp. BS5-3]|uniref:Lysylphosphatidylglycerol synthase transmembrane domain-containing protein n=1 Tax=Yoonia phaeophyticola TaxID=3137369 RepID=A0ABZ2V770_9RHOB
MIPPIYWRIGQLAFTAGLIALLWRTTDGPQIFRILQQAQPIWLAAAIGVLLCQTVLSAWRWQITAAQLGQKLPLGYAVKEYFMSQIVNQALPGAIMGDAARAVRARAQAGLAAATQAVLFERLAGQIAMFMMMSIAFLITFTAQGGLTWPPEFAAPIGSAIAVGIGVGGAIALGSRFPNLIGQRLAAWIAPMYRAVLAKHVLPAQIGLGLAITLCNLAAFGLCAWAVGVHLSLAAICAIVPVILFSMLIPFTISGWGVREGAAAVLLPLAGTTPSEAVAASVIFGCALLLAVLPGLIAVILK